MTFRWTRTPDTITATCDACGAQITGRTDTQILRDQRAHDVAACVTRQRAARVAAMGENRYGVTVSGGVMGAANGRIGHDEAAPDLTPKPPLSSPFDTTERSA